MLCDLGNAAIQERREAWRFARKSLGFNDQSKSLTAIRADDADWRALDANVARGALRRVDNSFQAFYRRCRAGVTPGFPRFKSRRRYECVEVRDPRPANVKRKANGDVVVRFKGMPRVTCRPSRPIPEGTPKAIRIVRRPTGCTVDLVCDVAREPLPATPAAVGIDMGVRKRMTLSTGEVIAPAVRDDGAVVEAQQAIARCKRGSNRRRKRVMRLRRLRRRQAVRNRNACHRITTPLVRRYGTICVEKLNIANMTRSGTGKRGLNRSILNQTWGIIRRQLAYKAEWAGRQLVEVNPAFTSRTCSFCGARHDPGKAETWQCQTCGRNHDRDVNAAINILRAGSQPAAPTRAGNP